MFLKKNTIRSEADRGGKMIRKYYSGRRRGRMDGDYFSKPGGQAVVYAGVDFRRFGVGQYL